MPQFYFPCQFLGLKEGEEVHHEGFGITGRKLRFEIFDAAYMANHHKLETCYQNMEVFFERVFSEIYTTNCETDTDAKDSIEILRAGLIMNGSINFPIPYVSNVSMHSYCLINTRTSMVDPIVKTIF
ncbi:hypothetical protein L2W58_11110 [Dethiosulfovibrio sp. F2B]|uniref:hypothetical protein n=1 Tax=Dethiosulfovibrio faecalis TaxID=2720018 RepID=UPI001F2CF16B|nr:hypothetical protein [Dethiosulfovibrio faecalis]MCF4152344.1 hypothetical protein [Dethiosulfovibrio faecalis]